MTKLNSITRYIVALGLIAIMVLTMAAPSFAAEKIDLSKDTTLTVAFPGDEKVPGMEFSVYKVAEFDEKANLNMLDKYKAYKVGDVPEDQAGFRTLASTLQGYVKKDNIKADYTATTDEKGVASFGVVERGLYLLISTSVIYEGRIYVTTPSMVVVPNLDENDEWVNDVVVAPKYSSSPLPPKDEKMTLNAIKVWEGDKENERPASIILDLVCDGEVIDSVTLSKYNNWRVTWKDLDPAKEYNVVETIVPGGYEVQIEKEGFTYTVKNYIPGTPDKPVKDSYEEPDKEDEKPTPPSTPQKNPPTPPTTTTKLPQTGQLWWPVPILMGAGFVFFLAGIIRKRRNA